jgi:hypothetical protein
MGGLSRQAGSHLTGAAQKTDGGQPRRGNRPEEGERARESTTLWGTTHPPWSRGRERREGCRREASRGGWCLRSQVTRGLDRQGRVHGGSTNRSGGGAAVFSLDDDHGAAGPGGDVPVDPGGVGMRPGPPGHVLFCSDVRDLGETGDHSTLLSAERRPALRGQGGLVVLPNGPWTGVIAPEGVPWAAAFGGRSQDGVERGGPSGLDRFSRLLLIPDDPGGVRTPPDVVVNSVRWSG